MTTEEVEGLREMMMREWRDQSPDWLGRAAEAVARAVRAQDAARGGTLSAENVEAFRGALNGILPGIDGLFAHFAAQGRTIAALTQECDDVRAQLAAKDARIASLKAQLEKMQPIVNSAVERAEAAESALAKLRQAVEEAQDLLGDTSDNATKAYQVLERGLSATPAPEHPDTATLPKDVVRWLSERPCCPGHEEHHLSVLPCREPYRDALRAIRERAKDADALWDAFRDGCKRAKSGAKTYEEEVEGMHEVVRYLLDDAGPSGGGEKTATKPADKVHFGDGGWGYQYCDHDAGRCVGKPHPTRPTTPLAVAARGPTREEDVERECPNCSMGCFTTADGCVGCHYGRPTLTPASTPEEDWRSIRAALALVDGRPDYDVPVKRAFAALARLREEPRRAAEAMRERCVTELRASGDHDEAERRMRALPL